MIITMSTTQTIDDYIKIQPANVAERLTIIRELVHKIIPGTEESISYAIPCFKKGKARLYMSGYKNHIGMYPVHDLHGLSEQLLPYSPKNTKASVHFKHADDLPLEVIESIIRAKLEAN
jgi:uncharacterized protein YdhG (YjbR/CyaY superfamily)